MHYVAFILGRRAFSVVQHGTQREILKWEYWEVSISNTPCWLTMCSQWGMDKRFSKFIPVPESVPAPKPIPRWFVLNSIKRWVHLPLTTAQM